MFGPESPLTRKFEKSVLFDEVTPLSVTSFLATVALLSGVFVIVIWYTKRWPFLKLASSLPGPKTLPLIGNAHLFVGKATRDVTNILLRYLKTYPSICRFWFGPFLVVLVENPEYFKTLLVKYTLISKAYHYKFLKPVFGTGLLTISAKRWRAHRRLIQPTFNTEILKTFMTTFRTNTRELALRMEESSKNSEINVLQYISMCTLDTICETTLGTKMGAQETEDFEFRESLNTLTNIMMSRLSKTWLYPDVLFNLSSHGKKHKIISACIEKHTDKIIGEKRQRLLDANCTDDSDHEDEIRGEPTRKSLLDMLIEMKSGKERLFSNQQIRYDVNTMAFVGTDSTMTSVGFLMLMFAMYPEIQEKVYQELCGIYDNGEHFERDIAFEDLDKMVYLERVIKETLRIFPVAPIFARQSTGDLDIGDHVIPKGTPIIFMVLSMHRNEKYWPEPLKFDPDRFLPEEIAKRHPYAYVPFGAGPRNCIGMKYATMFTKMACATILRRNIVRKDHIVPIENIELSADIALRPVKEITVRLERRTSVKYQNNNIS